MAKAIRSSAAAPPRLSPTVASAGLGRFACAATLLPDASKPRIRARADPTQLASARRRRTRYPISGFIAATVCFSRLLLPIGLDDRAVVAQDQVQPVRVVGDAPDSTRRHDPAQYLGQVLLTHDAGLPGRCL